MATKNVLATHFWDMGTTGEAAELTATLKRYTSSAETAATETVTIAEVGATGVYYITYTPENAVVYKLQVIHDGAGGAGATYRETWYEDVVNDAPSTTVATDAYASEADVATYAQMGDYTASTKPTETQVTTMLADRAADVYGKLSTIMGSAVTGPPSYSRAINTGTDAGLALARATRKANAIGAAIDAILAAGAGDSPGGSQRIADLVALYDMAIIALKEPAVAYLGHSSRSQTHVSAGQVTLPTRVVSDQQDLVMTSVTEF